MADKFIRLSDETAIEMLAEMAEADFRKDGAEVAWLIRKEYAEREKSKLPTVSAETPAGEGER